MVFLTHVYITLNEHCCATTVEQKKILKVSEKNSEAKTMIKFSAYECSLEPSFGGFIITACIKL